MTVLGLSSLCPMWLVLNTNLPINVAVDLFWPAPGLGLSSWEGDGDRGGFGCVCVIFIFYFWILQKRSIWCWSVRILNVLGRWLWCGSDIYINIHTNTCCNAIWCQSSTGNIGASAGLHLALNFHWGKFTSHAPPFCLTSKPKGWPSGAEGCFVKFIIFLPPPSSFRSFHVCKGQALQLGPSVTCQNTFLSKTEEWID